METTQEERARRGGAGWGLGTSQCTIVILNWQKAVEDYKEGRYFLVGS